VVTTITSSLNSRKESEAEEKESETESSGGSSMLVNDNPFMIQEYVVGTTKAGKRDLFVTFKDPKTNL